MIAVFARDRTLLGVSMFLPFGCFAVLMAFVPGRLQSSNPAAFGALLLGMAVVVTSTRRHAQPAVSLRPALYGIGNPDADGSRTSWERWLRKADRTAEHGRALAVLVFSAAITAIVVYAWLV